MTKETIMKAESDTLYWLKAALVVVLILLGLTSISYLRSASASRNQISIMGTGRYMVTPDLAVLSFRVSTRGVSATEAERGNKEKMNDVRDYLRDVGIADADVSVSGFNVSPYFEGESEIVTEELDVINYWTSTSSRVPPPIPSLSEISGYNTVASYNVKVRDAAMLDSLTEGVVKSGAEEISGIRYTFSDEEAVLRSARELALADARERAEILEKSLDINLGRVLNYYEDRMPYDYSMYDPYYSYGKGGDYGVTEPYYPLEPGETGVTLNVNIIYEIK